MKKIKHICGIIVMVFIYSFIVLVTGTCDIKAATSTSDVTEPTLPDPAAFLGGATAQEDHSVGDSGWHVYYQTEIDEGWTAGHEYIELLSDSRFNFELRESFSDTVLYLTSEEYFFDYTGSESVEPVQDRYYRDGYQDYSADLHVCLQKNCDGNYTGMTIDYSLDLIIQDLGDRASTVPDEAESSSSSEIDHRESYTPDFAKLPCLTCGGSGDCKKCNGYGTVNVYLGKGDYTDGTCPECRGSGKCRTCGGSGTR